MDNGKMLPQLSAIILEEQTGLTLTEVCQACAVRVEFIVGLVDEGVLEKQKKPAGYVVKQKRLFE